MISEEDLSVLQEIMPIDALFDFTVYPNPTDGNFTIDLFNTDAAPYLVEIFNSSGVLVSRAYNSANPLSISRSDLPDGVYLVRVSVRGESVTKRLMGQSHFEGL
jgi:hypothetical protein